MHELEGQGKLVIIVGDGHAGVGAAVRLTDLGYRVTIVELHIHVGQSTSGEATDASQHTLMRMGTNQRDLYRRLGLIRVIDWHKTLYFTGSDGLIDHLTGDDLPAPFHLTRGLMAMKRFNWREKFSIFSGFLAALQVGRAAREKLSDENFRQWLVSFNFWQKQSKEWPHRESYQHDIRSQNVFDRSFSWPAHHCSNFRQRSGRARRRASDMGCC